MSDGPALREDLVFMNCEFAVHQLVLSLFKTRKPFFFHLNIEKNGKYYELLSKGQLSGSVRGQC